MHILFLAAWTVVTLLLCIWLIPGMTIESTSGWAVWLSGAAAVVGAGAALFAAIFLKETLRETQEATKLMRKQLMQNRAYVVLEDLTVELPEIGSEKYKRFKISAMLRNSGSSPAVDAVYSYKCGDVTSQFEKTIDVGLAKGAKHSLGHNSVKRIEFEHLTGLANPLLASPSGKTFFVYIQYEYSDVYGNRYQYEVTNHVRYLPPGRLTLPGLAPDPKPIEAYIAGNRNGEKQIIFA
ncbi:MAG: hypothetical protein Q7L07_19450 [Pseudohongiella sp.]|nr:hypothetical protein [Pseudohongiella sp.]